MPFRISGSSPAPRPAAPPQPPPPCPVRPAPHFPLSRGPLVSVPCLSPPTGWLRIPRLGLLGPRGVRPRCWRRKPKAKSRPCSFNSDPSEWPQRVPWALTPAKHARLRKVTPLAQGHTAGRGGARSQIQAETASCCLPQTVRGGGEPQLLLSPNPHLPPGGFLAVSWVRCEQMALPRVHPSVCPTIIQHLPTHPPTFRSICLSFRLSVVLTIIRPSTNPLTDSFFSRIYSSTLPRVPTTGRARWSQRQMQLGAGWGRVQTCTGQPLQ